MDGARESRCSEFAQAIADRIALSEAPAGA
jgi:hypothetical protein